MVITRRWAIFLTLVGVWTWFIWPRFGLAIYRDDRSFADGAPTAFLWVHAVLIAASLAIGTTVGVLGVRAWFAARAGRSTTRSAAEEFAGVTASRPQD
jgi:hypothetical protein